MSNKQRGYAYAIVKANASADQSLIGVQLGKFCIDNDIPVSVIAEQLRVSRQAIYTWFVGKFQPRADKVQKIGEIMSRRDHAPL